MRDEIKSLLRDRRHCVMATAANDQPYCSLMVYAVNADCTRLFMVTRRNTRKYRNLKNNPYVSLLVDSRDIAQPQALTIEGVFEEVAGDSEKKQIQHQLTAEQPGLQTLLDSPDAAIISVTINSVVFLNGLTEAYREPIE